MRLTERCFPKCKAIWLGCTWEKISTILMLRTSYFFNEQWGFGEGFCSAVYGSICPSGIIWCRTAVRETGKKKMQHPLALPQILKVWNKVNWICSQIQESATNSFSQRLFHETLVLRGDKYHLNKGLCDTNKLRKYRIKQIRWFLFPLQEVSEASLC